MTRDDILTKAGSIINGERQGIYGNAEDSFGVIAGLWSAYLGKDISSADVANMMILMKVARNSSGVYQDDNWIDICGYAALGGEIQDPKFEHRLSDAENATLNGFMGMARILNKKEN